MSHTRSYPQQLSRHCRPSPSYPPAGYGGSPPAEPPYPPRQGAVAQPRPPQPRGTAPANYAGQGQGYPTPGSATPPPLRRRQRRRPRAVTPPQVWLAGAGGGMLALAALVVIPQVNTAPAVPSNVCQERVQGQAVLSRQALGQLLTIPERASRDQVRQVVEEPYCLLPEAEIRAGVMAEREAYPLAFDPQTWVVILYEEGEYAGYDFDFRR